MNSIGRRVLSLLLCVCITLSVVPVFAFADETTANVQEVVETIPETSEVVAEETAEEATEETTEEATEETTEEATEETTEEATEETTEEATEEATEETVSAEPVKYTVNYYKWDWDLEADVLMESEELTGLPGALTEVQAKEYEGLILMDEIVQVEIAADGTTVVDVYYTVELDAAAFVDNSKLYDTSVSEDYFKVISENSYDLAPGAVEHEIVLNNAGGNDRKVAHIIEVDPKNTDIQVLPGYYEIDKFDPKDTTTWKTAGVTKVADYYANTLGFNVVGAMNTALQYSNNAPYGFMVYNGQVLANNDLATGAKTYLAVTKNEDGTVEFELRSIDEALHGDEWQAVSANFGWLVKDGKMTSTSGNRDNSDASRSMLGIKADGSLVICQVDGRNAPVSTGLSDYEMSEMMLALGCVWAVNGDGGGSSSFVTKRSGSDELVMRSVPSDGSERPTINSVIVVSTAGASGEFAEVLFETGYDYIAPGASMAVSVTGLDTKQFTMDIPAEVTYQVAEEGMGTVENGVFTAGSTTGIATIQAVYNGNVVGQKVLNVVHPEIFGFAEEATVIPYGKSIMLEVKTACGADNWAVCVDGVYTFALSDAAAATLDGDKLTATNDETVKGVDVTVTYTSDATKTDVLKVEYGKGSEVLFDFEDGDTAGFMGFQEAKQWSADNNVNNTLVGDAPLAGQFNNQIGSKTSLASAASGGQVKNGNYALAWSLDNTDATFGNWSYNVLFNVGEPVVLRDVANGKNATSLGMWLYIPEGAPGLSFQSQLYVKNADGSLACKQDHFTFETVSGVRKNLNSCTEADIPASRWVYASIPLTAYDYIQTPDPMDESNSRSPSIIRTYVKPTAPYMLTFYIDDITLDYSSAVDDRVAPTITTMEYSSADTAVELENEVTVINASEAAFSAKVTDAGSLNLDTAQIYMDGNKVDTQVNGNVMSTKESVSMSNGIHKVTFEIADDLGNYTQQSVIFTVNYSEEKSLVYMDGHNDSGEKPECDSVYYVDIKTSDISKVETVEANIMLNSANTWELEHMTVAEGFEVTWEVMEANNTITTFAANTDIHSTENVAIITITKNGDCKLTGEQTLASLPVRLWSWNGVDNVTGQPITPEEQYKTGYCPIVTVDYEVLFGYAETTEGEVVSFNGSASVETMINDTVNPWHYHDKELTVLNKEVTCTTDGYENRTYCETCKSVIDWGTKLEAAGHTYAIVNDQLTCDCGAILGGTGLVTVNDKIYVLIADKLVTGWQNSENKWCYADPTTKEVYTGEFTVDGITYTAGEDGLLVSGTWVEDFIGRRYSYGPDFYTRCFQTIDGEEYYFEEYTGYALTGYQAITENRNDPNAKVRWYHFAEDGKLLERLTMTGVLDTGDGLFYMEDGCVTFAGMVKVGDDYYCSSDKKGTVLTGYNWVGSYIMNNSKNPMATGYYEFGADGKLLQGIVTKEDGTYYYEMGKPVEAGWVKDGDDYYCFTTGGKAMTGRNWVGTYLNQTSKNPYKAGTFIFAQDGKLANGVVETDDGWYYCEDGVGKCAYLVNIDGQYYYADEGGKLATGRIWVGTYPSHGLLPKGYYEFGDNGLMLNGVVEKEDGVYYFEQGQPVDTGWLKVGDDYYVFTNGGKALTGYNWVGSYLTQTSRNPYTKGNFYFTEDGKLANGVMQKEDGWYYNEAGVAKEAGLVKIGDDYYLAEAGGKLATGRVWVGTYAAKDMLPKGYYEFGEDGKMLQGVVEKDDGLYYYELGNAKYLGLTERNGEYYYVNEGGKLETGRVWVGTYPSNGLVTKGYYEFDNDGTMLNGFEQLSDGLYYYDMGTAKYIGLKVIGSDLYYINEGGKVETGYVYVGTYTSNGLIPKGYYTFDEEGKFVK